MAIDHQCHVVLTGAGATGSNAAIMIARVEAVTELTLIDHDVVEARNVGNQAISAAHVGHAKVDALDQLIRTVRTGIKVNRIAKRVENVPLANLRCDVLVSAVDNRETRQYLNEVACRLGLTWFNTAVDGASLVRVDGYRTTESAPCMECAWSDEQYSTLAQVYPCDDLKVPAPPTNSTIEVGAIAGALLTAEVRKVATGYAESSLIGRQLMLELSSHAHHLSCFRRNPDCRMTHQPWSIEPIECDPDATDLDGLFDLVGGDDGAQIGLLGQRFVTHLDCVRCDRRSSVGLVLYGRLDPTTRVCQCGGAMLAAGFYSFDALRRSDLAGSMQRIALADLGLMRGDIITVRSESGIARHFELVGGDSH